MVQKPASSFQIHKSLWLPNLITFIILILFLLLAFAIDEWVKPQFSPASLMITGVLMALVPAAIWIGFFYRQDRLEPEPKSLVLRVFLLGGLLAAAIGIPLVEDGFNVSAWLYDSPWTNLLGAILVIGFVQEFLKFAAVRFSVFESAEFDEKTDGIIYSTSAGLGFATMLNIAYVVNSGGVDLGMGSIRIVLVALAQASFAGITGYFMGREKLEKRPAWWMPLGVSLSALLNGLFFYFWGNLTHPTLSSLGGFVNPWLGLGLAAILAAGVTMGLSWLIRRDQNRVVPSQEV